MNQRPLTKEEMSELLFRISESYKTIRTNVDNVTTSSTGKMLQYEQLLKLIEWTQCRPDIIRNQLRLAKYQDEELKEITDTINSL